MGDTPREPDPRGPDRHGQDAPRDRARRRSDAAKAACSFTRAADLVRQLLEARDARELGRLQRLLLTQDVIIIDELGFVPFDRVGGELLFNLIADRYERRATVVTTNLASAERVTVLPATRR